MESIAATLKIHGVSEAETGSPREILQTGYKHGFIDDSDVWLAMLKKRSLYVHIYDENEVDEMLLMIRNSFISAFIKLEKTLGEKIKETEENWN